MDNENMKIVDFEKYCSTCKHYKLTEDDDPCTFCLDVPARQYSHKPEKWEEK